MSSGDWEGVAERGVSCAANCGGSGILMPRAGLLRAGFGASTATRKLRGKCTAKGMALRAIFSPGLRPGLTYAAPTALVGCAWLWLCEARQSGDWRSQGWLALSCARGDGPVCYRPVKQLRGGSETRPYWSASLLVRVDFDTGVERRWDRALDYSTAILVPWRVALETFSMRASITSRTAFRNSSRELARCSLAAGGTPKASLK